jgi:hypothetical protein
MQLYRNNFPKAATSAAVASAQEVRLTHRLGAPSRRCHRVGTPAHGRCRQLELQRSTARARGRAGGARSKKPRRSQSAEEARGPQSGRARGAKGPDPLAVNAQRLWLRLGENKF